MAPVEAESDSTEIRRQKAINLYPRLYREIIQDWSSQAPEDAAWLIYSANYLFRTGGIRWAIDPVVMNWRVPETQPVDYLSLAENLDFVLLTHDHSDHLDLGLLILTTISHHMDGT